MVKRTAHSIAINECNFEAAVIAAYSVSHCSYTSLGSCETYQYRQYKLFPLNFSDFVFLKQRILPSENGSAKSSPTSSRVSLAIADSGPRRQTLVSDIVHAMATVDVKGCAVKYDSSFTVTGTLSVSIATGSPAAATCM